MQRCENGRADVEAALAQRRPARPVRPGRRRRSPRRRVRQRPPRRRHLRAASGPDDDEVDPSELVDATDVAATSVDRVKELFPGAELVDPS
jgi:hypothetical protein